jgi:hypothetical protein
MKTAINGRDIERKIDAVRYNTESCSKMDCLPVKFLLIWLLRLMTYKSIGSIPCRIDKRLFNFSEYDPLSSENQIAMYTVQSFNT